MTRIAPVRMNLNPRTFWFDALDFEIEKDQKIVVQTVRGVELGTLADSVFEMDDSEAENLKNPLKPIVRIATQEDIDNAREMERLSSEAMPVYRQFVEESNLDMRPVSVEYLLDGDKAIFYFESEDRVDFRELVRKLASHFHVRVDMRQIGVRDEARMIGGLGHCGQELCCARMGGDFNPVTIRMAKEQDLSLNPQKISGTCGRLMCCLRYEFDAYKDFNSRAPKKNATIQTPDGPAKVIALDVPREVITLKLEGESEKTVKVPLDSFDAPDQEEGKDRVRPNSISADAWNDVLSKDDMSHSMDGIFITSQFTHDDRIADSHSARGERARGEGAEKPDANNRRKNRQGKSRTEGEKPAPSDRKRRRRSTKLSSSASGSSGKEQTSQKKDASEKAASSPIRPGHKSSGLRSVAGAAGDDRRDESASSKEAQKKSRNSNRRRGGKKKNAVSADGSNAQGGNRQAQRQDAETAISNKSRAGEPNVNAHRRPRRRSHKTGGTTESSTSSE